MTPERLKEIIALLAQPGFRVQFLETVGAVICGPEHKLDSAELFWLSDHGWLAGMPSNCGAWLSDRGRAAYLQSEDEMGSGELPRELQLTAVPAAQTTPPPQTQPGLPGPPGPGPAAPAQSG